MAHDNETEKSLEIEEAENEAKEAPFLDVEEKSSEEESVVVEGVIDENFDDGEKAMGGPPGEMVTRRVIPMTPLEEEEEEEEEEEDEEEEQMEKSPMPMSEGEEMDPAEKRKLLRQRLLDQLAALDAEDEDEDEGDMEKGADETVQSKELLDARAKRLLSMGYKSEEISSFVEDAFLCAIKRKVLTDRTPCEWCRGGCMAEKGLPGLLDIEAKAEEEYGEVINSGYSAADGVFVVDIKTKDHGLIEALYYDDGSPGGWLKLDDIYLSEDGEIEGKSIESVLGAKIVTVDDAEDIAVKELPGISMSVAPATFEGYDAYLVEIEGANGKSYDAYVALDGSFLGYDEFDLIDDDEDEGEKSDSGAEVKEYDEDDIEFKKFYSADDRRSFGKRGWALPDGSFPIKDEQDLKNAIRLAGNSKNPNAAKAHIMKRAAQLGLEKLIPESWLPKKKGEELDIAFEKELMEFQMMAVEEEIKDSE